MRLWCWAFIILPLFHLLQRLLFPRVEHFEGCGQFLLEGNNGSYLLEDVKIVHWIFVFLLDMLGC